MKKAPRSRPPPPPPRGRAPAPPRARGSIIFARVGEGRRRPGGSPWSRDLSPPEATASAETRSSATEGAHPAILPAKRSWSPRARPWAPRRSRLRGRFPARFSPTLVFFSAEGGAPSVVFKPTKSLRNSSSMTRGERASVETPRRARRRCARAGVTRLTNAKSVVPNSPLDDSVHADVSLFRRHRTVVSSTFKNFAAKGLSRSPPSSQTIEHGSAWDSP